MKIYFHGWFGGFFEKTNPGLHVDFFLNLFENVYGEKCYIGSIENSQILCEFDMLINSLSLVKSRSWKHTYLFSGESTLNCNKNNYTCVLWGERNHKNVVNLPLFIPYIYTNNFLNNLEINNKHNTVPNNNVLVIISNPQGNFRNTFLEKLDKNFKVCYGGTYKNNIGGLISPKYNTTEFTNIVSQFKFIISMENSREDTYITEKVIHGLLAKTIPVYWGSERLYDYFNEERIIYLQDENSIDNIIQKMLEIKNDNNKYLSIVNSNIFSNKDNKLERTLDSVVNDIRCLLSNNKWSNVERIYCVNNPLFELERNKNLQKLFVNESIDSCFIKYISPTYKHTITQDIYTRNIKEQLVQKLRNNPMKKGELSLFLNYKANLEHIVKNHKDGIFIIFESDVLVSKDIKRFNKFLNDIKDKNWDSIHIGKHLSNLYDIPIIQGITGYRKNNIFNKDLIEIVNNNISKNKVNYIEDITNSTDEFRLIRKFHTTCTDSIVWKYSGIKKFLNYMNTETNYGSPFDYFMINFFENNIDFKHYWSVDEFFVQGSMFGDMDSTLGNK